MESCIFCAEKHLAKAHVYWGEAQSGYAGRFTMMLGELAAAEEECRDEYPPLAHRINTVRKTLEADRGTAWVPWQQLLVMVEQLAKVADPSKRKMPENPPSSSPQSRVGERPPCVGCQEAAEKRKADEEARKNAPLLVILTAISGWSSSYSLATVIQEQAKAASAAGFRVKVVGMQNMSKRFLAQLPGVEWVGLIPNCTWKDDQVNDTDVDHIVGALRTYLASLGPAKILTHDWMLISSYVTLAKAIHVIGASIPNLQWYHQIHSSLGARPTAPDAKWRCSLPAGHMICAVNHADIPDIQRYYQTEKVVVLPNSRDIRPMMRTTGRVTAILSMFPLHLADVAQVYPLSTPRAEAKGLDKVIKTFGALVRKGSNARLLVANAHPDGETPARIMREMTALAIQEGLEGRFAWTSELCKHGSDGLTQEEVFSLLSVSNVFCFPSTSESAGLVVLEAALAGCLPVLNFQLAPLSEYVVHKNALWVHWGSIKAPGKPDVEEGAADAILAALEASHANLLKRRVLQVYGLEALSERMKDLFWK